MRIATTNSKEWSLIGSSRAGGDKEEEVSPWMVDGMVSTSWEDNALARFSEFLRFSTMGYEDEIFYLLRCIRYKVINFTTGKALAKYFEI